MAWLPTVINLLFIISLWFSSHAFAAPSKQVVLSANDHAGPVGTGLKDVREALVASQIIPTVIDDFEPSFVLDVGWKKSNALLGNTLKVKRLKKEPDFSLKLSQNSPSTVCSSNMTYIVTLTDPDAPSRGNPKWAEMCHFIAAGLALSPSGEESCSQLSVLHLKDIIPYKPPGPPPKTGKHRYVFLVFAPANGTTDVLHPSKPSDRRHWGTGREGHGVRDWAHHNGLIPVAANFIYAANKKQ